MKAQNYSNEENIKSNCRKIFDSKTAYYNIMCHSQKIMTSFKLLTKNKFQKIALMLILLLLTISQVGFAQDMTGSINGNDFSMEQNLEIAIINSGISFEEIHTIEITGGTFTVDDWDFLKSAVRYLKNLKYFTITEGITAVDDIPKIDDHSYRRYFNKTIRKISVAKMKKIGKYAFYTCYALTTANFPQVTEIGDGAFVYCSALTTANFPQATKIGEEVFYKCSALTTTNFPQVTEIGGDAFGHCSALTTVNFPQVQKIKWDAFSNCDTLKTAIFPQLDTIRSGAFYNCKSLTNLSLGTTPPKKIENNSFKACPSDRHLIFLDGNGNLLVGGELVAAKNKYIAVDDGNNTDNLWYEWQIDKSIYSIHKNTTNGNILVQSYAGSNEVVNFKAVADLGYVIKSGSLKAYKTIDNNTVVPIVADNKITMPNYAITIAADFETNNLQVIVNGSINKSGTTLENALKDIPLNSITSIKISQGYFSDADWYYLRSKKNELTALLDFTITNSITTIDDIPDSYESYFNETLQKINVAKIKNIGRQAFKGCSALTTTNFPQVTEIGNSAFSHCSALTTTNFPQATKIGNSAFSHCSALTTANFLQVTKIENSAFYNCSALTTANFPQATKIENGAFSHCSALTTANFPQVTEIGEDVFYKCFALTTANFPQATRIEEYAFFECSALTTANFPKVTSIGRYAFKECFALTTANFPEATYIGSDAFRSCYALATINFPKVKKIGNAAFIYCYALATANFPQATKIGYNAFYKCSALTTANFPKVTEIGQGAFYNCSALKKLALSATPPNSSAPNIFKGCPQKRQIVFIDENKQLLTGAALTDARDNYKNVDDGDKTDNLWYGWQIDKDMFKIMSSPIVKIQEYAYNGELVKFWVIPQETQQLDQLTAYKTTDPNQTITISGKYSFTMPNYNVSVKATEKYNNLTIIINGNTPKTNTTLERAIGSFPLHDIISIKVTDGYFGLNDWNYLKNKTAEFTSLTEFIIEDNKVVVENIPNTSYEKPYFNDKIKKISIKNIKTIGHNAFNDCISLTEVNFPNVLTIGNSVFNDCISLTEVNFPNVSTIGAYAFSGDISLKKVEMGMYNVTYIGRYGFENCQSLVSVVFPSVKEINDWTFKGCSSLKSAVFMSDTVIGDRAFADCKSLTKLMLSSTPPRINYKTFDNCPSPRQLVCANIIGSFLSTKKYKKYDDGDSTDNLWYGWEIDKKMHYAVTAPMSHGTIGVQRLAYKGEKVSLQIQPNTGYSVKPGTLKAHKTGAPTTTIVISADNSFIMPDYNITIEAQFEPKNTLHVKINETTVKQGYSLENALETATLNSIETLEITAGRFTSIDWLYLKSKKEQFTKLTEFSITDNITAVEDLLFDQNRSYFNNKIQKISVAKIKKIGKYVFRNCSALTTANFPQATSIGRYAFDGCYALTTANFPQVTEIGHGAFSGCYALTTANFPQTTEIEEYAFSGCYALTTANFPQATEIGEDAFYECSALTTANFPQATEIEEYAFSGCYALTTANFPQVTEIGRGAFYGCYALTKLGLSGTPPTCSPYYTFYGCPEKRQIIFVQPDGTPLTGSAFSVAKNNYKAVNDDNNNDNLWYGWEIDKNIFYEISATNTANGAVNVQKKAYPTEQVSVFITPEFGYSLKSRSLKAYKTGDPTASIDISVDNKFIMPNYDITIEAQFEQNNLQVVINGNINKQATTLEDALNGLELSSIYSIKIVGGWFFSNNWEYLKKNKNKLTALTDFVISNEVVGVDNIELEVDRNEYYPAYFSHRLQNLSIAKIQEIGFAFFTKCYSLKSVNLPQAIMIKDRAFSLCKNLTTAYMPSVKFISGAFYKCSSLNKLGVGSTPPGYYSGHKAPNYGLPTSRQLVFLNPNGEYFNGTELKTIQEKYKADENDGNITDSLWFGWRIEYILINDITLNETSKQITVNEGFTLIPAITPDTASILKVIWTSSDDATVSVDDNGKITGLKAGKAYITATTVEGNHQATCEVTVTTTSIETTDNQKIMVFPNPAPGIFTVKTTGQYDMQIIDISGKVIDNKKINEETTVELSGGVYFLKFNKENENPIVKKVIIK